MHTYTNTAGHVSHAWAGGWLPLAGVTHRDACRTAALDALAATGGPIDLPTVPTAPSAGMTPLDAGGKMYDRARWTVAYRGTLAWFDLPWGTVWVPCMVCGHLFDAWTCDSEHVVARELGGAGTVDNLVLACHASNRGKGARPVHPATLARLTDVLAGLPTVKRGRASGTRSDGIRYEDVNPVDVTFKARARRSGRGDMTATPYAGR